MDTQWAFRQGYNTARKIKEKQDAYCAKALAGEWKDLGDFPEDLQWEALVDVLRGRVKVQNHCYEAVDLDGIVRVRGPTAQPHFGRLIPVVFSSRTSLNSPSPPFTMPVRTNPMSAIDNY
jgi:hypothetical protein